MHLQLTEHRQRSLALGLALVVDALVGEPPNALHPVAWLGQLITVLERRAPQTGAVAQFGYGVGIVATTVSTALVPGIVLERLLKMNNPFVMIGYSLLLKTTFARRALLEAGSLVHQQLLDEHAGAAHTALRALVSRDTAQLNPSLMAAAAIESLAENTSDSFVAPLCYYLCFGLPGACAYRAVNTLDAMLGYRGAYEFLGKAAARTDDLLNWLPARLTTALLVTATPMHGDDAGRTWKVVLADHGRTASPNAGYPLSAIAGALDVTLEKVGHYRLNVHGRAPHPADIRRAIEIVQRTCLLAATAALLLQVLRQDHENVSCQQ